MDQMWVQWSAKEVMVTTKLLHHEQKVGKLLKEQNKVLCSADRAS
jgi:hypothetical protein